MLWVSDALDESGRPAVVLLGASLTVDSVRGLNAYVDKELVSGEVLPGTYYESEDASVRAAIEVVGDWPAPTAFTLAHPIPETPVIALQLLEAGWRIVFPRA